MFKEMVSVQHQLCDLLVGAFEHLLDSLSAFFLAQIYKPCPSGPRPDTGLRVAGFGQHSGRHTGFVFAGLLRKPFVPFGDFFRQQQSLFSQLALRKSHRTIRLQVPAV